MSSERATLSSLVDEFERLGNQIAVVAPHGLRLRSTSYSAVAVLARRFAAELDRRGIRKGDRVILWGENGAEWIAAFFGCVLRGVLAVPIDLSTSPAFAKRVQDEVSPKLIVGSSGKLKDLPATVPVLSFEDLESTISIDPACAIEDLKETDPLQIVFTSGTTGDPKGVVHTHRNVLASLRPIEQEMQKYLRYERLVHPIRILHTLPLSHVFGQFMGLWIPALLRAEVHYESRLVASDIAERIKRERISVLATVPRILDLMRFYAGETFRNLPGRIEAAKGSSAWRRWWQFRDVHRTFGLKFWALVCGGASVSLEAEQFWNALGFVVVQGYGMTETTALVSLNHPFKAAQGTIGQVLPGREVRLSADGEVLVRGDTISSTSWKGGRLQQQEDEWLATGDLAEFDAHGNLRFRGRKKDVIVTSAGLNIYPEDLEAVLNRQPGVRTSTVIEMTSATGPEPLAALVLVSDLKPETIIGQANRELAEFQQIRRWLVWPENDFPRTSTGKIIKREVARRISEGELVAPQNGDGELNLDSLGRVQLQAQLEQQFGVSLDEKRLQEIKTHADVQKLVQTASASPASTADRSSQHRYPKWPWNPLMQAVRAAFLQLIAKPLTRALVKPMVRNCISEWPKSPVLLVANHVTSYDAALVLYALPRHLRKRVAIAMSGEIILDWRRARNQGHWFLNLVAPLEYWLVTALFNIFPLPQFSGFRRSFRHAGEAIDRGYSVLVFPEGRRSDDGTPQPFKSGSGLLWNELGIPAVPVRLEGLGELKVSGERWFRSGKIAVVVNEALPWAIRSPEEATELLRAGVFDH